MKELHLYSFCLLVTSVTFFLLSLRLKKYAPEFEGDPAGARKLRSVRMGSALALVGALLGGVACFYYASEQEGDWRGAGRLLLAFFTTLPHALFWLLLFVKAPQLSDGESKRRKQVSALFSGTLISCAALFFFVTVRALFLPCIAAIFIGVFGVVRLSSAYRRASFRRTRKKEDDSAADSEAVHPPDMRPAGFWIRWGAQFIDGTLFIVAYFVLAFVLSKVVFVILLFSYGLLVFLYEAVLTSSKKQGTLGKQALAIKVTTRDGGRLSFVRSIGRCFAKLGVGPILVLSYSAFAFELNDAQTIAAHLEGSMDLLFLIFVLGCILAAFMPRKQALQDLLARTYVVHGGRDTNRPARNRRGVKVQAEASGSPQAQEEESPE